MGDHIDKHTNKVEEQVKKMGGSGVQAKQVIQYARQQWKTDNEKVENHNDIIRDAIQRINKEKKPGDRTFNRSHPALNGGDYNSINGFDSVATSIVSEHKGSGIFHPDNDTHFKENQEKLWEMIQAGPQPKTSLQSAQQRAFDEWEASNPKLKADKPNYEPVNESPLNDKEQRAIHEAIPASYLIGNTAKAHRAIKDIGEAIKSKPTGEKATALAEHIKSLGSEELQTTKRALTHLKISTPSVKRTALINALLERAGLGHHAIDDQPKDVPFGEDLDDATQEERNAIYNRNLHWNGDVDESDDNPFQTAIAAWLDIDGDASDLAELLETAFKKPTLHAEPADRLVASTGTGKKADDREAIMNLMNKALTTEPAKLSGYIRNSLRAHGIDGALRSGILFTEKDRAKFQADLASVLATADLVGRARVRMRADQVYRRHASQFDERPPPMPEDFPLLTPIEAYDYFTKLVPSLTLHPDRFGELMERQAFTLAVATEKTLLEEIQKIIADSIANGTPGGAVTIRQLMIQTGTAPQNPQYAEAVYRTNVMDASAIGHDREMNAPDMQTLFPVFMYSAITGDGRGRPWHANKNGLLYPSSAGFVRVRGTSANDVINCRCTPIAIDKFELADRLAKGEEIQREW